MTRKEVIGELRELKHMFQRCYDKYPTCLEEAIDYIYQTQQRTGRWMFTDAAPHRVYCSECYKTFIPNKEWYAWAEHIVPRKYCPNCGARMEEQE